MPAPHRIGVVSRFAAGVVGILALGMAILFAWAAAYDGAGWEWRPIGLGVAFGLLFGYAAAAGRSPRWLEEWIGGRTGTTAADPEPGPGRVAPPPDERAP